MSDDPAAVFRRIVEEIINAGDPDAIDRLVTEDYVDHTGGDSNREGYRETIQAVREVFPDLQMTVHDTIVQGDKVAARFSVTATHRGEFMGIPATDRKVSWEGIGIIRVADGKMAERWNVSDMMGLYEQVDSPGGYSDD